MFRRLLATATAAVVASLAACGSSRPAAPPSSVGTVIPVGHPVPATPLVDEHGQAVTLESYRGKYVVLAQFLTLCQDECPLTTGALQTLQQSVQRAGLDGQVVFAEATVDPGRDSPARLLAYQQEFGAPWTLLTGTEATLAAFWKHFGIGYYKVAEDTPPTIDWWTHRPLTYDIDHTNGFILIDPAGDERFISTALPSLHGRLSPQLRTLLDPLGIAHLDNGISGNDYTIPEALEALSWLMGRHIPLATN
jgi:protein SCO1/2